VLARIWIRAARDQKFHRFDVPQHAGGAERSDDLIPAGLAVARLGNHGSARGRAWTRDRVTELRDIVKSASKKGGQLRAPDRQRRRGFAGGVRTVLDEKFRDGITVGINDRIQRRHSVSVGRFIGF